MLERSDCGVQHLAVLVRASARCKVLSPQMPRADHDESRRCDAMQSCRWN
jgi:hypothetical protein